MSRKYIYFTFIVALFAMIGLSIQKLFISKPEYTRMLVAFGQFNIPFTEVEIQGKTYPFNITLDFTRFPLYLTKDILSKMDKNPKKIIKTITNENEMEVKTYSISKIKMGDLIFSDVLVREVDNEKEKPKGTEKIIADIGLKFFERNNLLLDFANSTIISCSDLNKLKQVGYSIEEMAKTAFEIGSKGLILHVNTDLGVLKLRISTMNTWSLIDSCLIKDKETKDGTLDLSIFTTSSFIIGGQNFGEKDLMLYDFSESFDADGYIGMDFLESHVIYFDFKNKTAFVRHCQM
jgi:hypothetical protein